MPLNVTTYANSVVESSFALMKFMEVLMNVYLPHSFNCCHKWIYILRKWTAKGVRSYGIYAPVGILKSSVIYFWTASRQHLIYLLHFLFYKQTFLRSSYFRNKTLGSSLCFHQPKTWSFHLFQTTVNDMQYNTIRTSLICWSERKCDVLIYQFTLSSNKVHQQASEVLS